MKLEVIYRNTNTFIWQKGKSHKVLCLIKYYLAFKEAKNVTHNEKKNKEISYWEGVQMLECRDKRIKNSIYSSCTKKVETEKIFLRLKLRWKIYQMQLMAEEKVNKLEDTATETI